MHEPIAEIAGPPVTDGQIEYLAEELLLIQLGSVEDAVVLVEMDPTLRRVDRYRLIDAIRRQGGADND